MRVGLRRKIMVLIMEKPNFSQFVDAVLVMRDAQKAYFRSRVPDSLRYAKAREAEVDKMISNLKNMEPDHVKTPELFR